MVTLLDKWLDVSQTKSKQIRQTWDRTTTWIYSTVPFWRAPGTSQPCRAGPRQKCQRAGSCTWDWRSGATGSQCDAETFARSLCAWRQRTATLGARGRSWFRGCSSSRHRWSCIVVGSWSNGGLYPRSTLSDKIKQTLVTVFFKLCVISIFI